MYRTTVYDNFAEAVQHATHKLTGKDPFPVRVPRVEGVSPEQAREVIAAFVEEMADWMWYLNPNFNRDRFLEAAGFPRPKPVPDPMLTHEHIDQMVARYSGGASIAAVAKEFGVPLGEQRDLLVGAGVQIRKGGPQKGVPKSPCRPRATTEEIAAMVARRAEQATLTQIGEEFGFHATTVAQYLRDADREAKPKEN